MPGSMNIKKKIHGHITYIYITQTQNLVTVTTGCGIIHKDTSGSPKISLQHIYPNVYITNLNKKR
jgi:hypothetical protein